MDSGFPGAVHEESYRVHRHYPCTAHRGGSGLCRDVLWDLPPSEWDRADGLSEWVLRRACVRLRSGLNAVAKVVFLCGESLLPVVGIALLDTISSLCFENSVSIILCVESTLAKLRAY